MKKRLVVLITFVLLFTAVVFLLASKTPGQGSSSGSLLGRSSAASRGNGLQLTGKNSGAFIYNGNISSTNIQNCVSPLPLQLKRIYVEDGSQVKKGDLLYLLDDSDIAASLWQAQAGIQLAQVNLERAQLAADTSSFIAAKSAYDSTAAAYNEAKINFERISTLYQMGGVSQSDYERTQIAVLTAEGQYNQARSNYETIGEQSSLNVRASQAQLAQARAIYEAAKVNESKRRVIAEIDGMVADIWANENNMLAAGHKIMDIVDYENLVLEIAVDQFEMSDFDLYKTIPVYVHALNKTVRGTVSRISNQAVKTNEVSSFIVTIDLEKDPALKIGLLAEVKINV